MMKRSNWIRFRIFFFFQCSEAQVTFNLVASKRAAFRPFIRFWWMQQTEKHHSFNLAFNVLWKAICFSMIEFVVFVVFFFLFKVQLKLNFAPNDWLCTRPISNTLFALLMLFVSLWVLFCVVVVSVAVFPVKPLLFKQWTILCAP